MAEKTNYFAQDVPTTEHRIRAEQSIAGAILLDEKVLDVVRTEVKAKMFSVKRNRDIFEAACQLQDEKSPVDPRYGHA